MRPNQTFDWRKLPVAVIQELHFPALTTEQATDVRQALTDAFWYWFDRHRNDVVFTTKVWFIRINVTVGQLEAVFVKVFGPR